MNMVGTAITIATKSATPSNETPAGLILLAGAFIEDL